jgi:apolipoprotein N-acyltransferase
VELWNRRATNRLTSAVYDFVLLIVAVWFALSSAPWVPWTVFLLVNLAGLLLFNNRFVQRDLTLMNRWGVVFVLCVEAGLLVWLDFAATRDAGRTIMAVSGLAFVVGVRLCFQPAEAAVRARRPRPTTQ